MTVDSETHILIFIHTGNLYIVFNHLLTLWHAQYPNNEEINSLQHIGDNCVYSFVTAIITEEIKIKQQIMGRKVENSNRKGEMVFLKDHKQEIMPEGGSENKIGWAQI